MDGNEKLYDFARRSDECGLCCNDPSLTVQADAEDADINVIVHRFGLTGEMPVGMRVPQYQDYEGVFDFRTAQEQILYAQREFMSMPAEVRRRFENNPQVFLEFAADPANVDAMVEMGLAIEKPKAQDSSAADGPPKE